LRVIKSRGRVAMSKYVDFAWQEDKGFMRLVAVTCGLGTKKISKAKTLALEAISPLTKPNLVGFCKFYPPASCLNWWISLLHTAICLPFQSQILENLSTFTSGPTALTAGRVDSHARKLQSFSCRWLLAKDSW